MEHASDAIIMAGAILIFVIALSTAMMVFSQVRATTDTVMYASDETNFYEYLGDTINPTSSIKSRIVGWETVIPTLYKYYKENYTVVFLQSGTIAKVYPLYKTITNNTLWSGYGENATNPIPPIVNKYHSGTNDNETICSFDVDEETRRHEPWTGSTEDYKNHLDAFLKGGIFKYPKLDPDDPNSTAYNYKDDNSNINKGGFISRVGQNAKFIETIGEYRSDGKTRDENETTWDLDEGVRNKKLKRVIVYQLQ